MVWAFLWRFVVAALVLGYLLTRVAGFLIGLNGGSFESARTAGFWAEGIAVVLAAFFALGSAQNRAREPK